MQWFPTIEGTSPPPFERPAAPPAPDTPVLLGGPGTNQEEATGLGADGWAATAAEGVELLEVLLAERGTNGRPSADR